MQSPLSVKMEDQLIIKKNIQENLRYGDLTKIKDAVFKNKNKLVSVSHVRNVLNPEMSRWDDDVIEEGQVIAIKNQQSLISARSKVL